MSRAYVDVKKWHRNIELMLNEPDNKASWADFDFGTTQNCAIDMAARLARYFAEDSMKFYGTLIECLKSKAWYNSTIQNKLQSGDAPLIVYGPELTNMRIFPNITINAFYTKQSGSQVRKCHRYSYAFDPTDNSGVLGTFTKNLREDLNDKSKSRAWDSPSRIWKRLKRSEVITIEKVLTNYFKLDKAINTSGVRDIAALIVEARQPMELIFADKPEDFMSMYRDGPPSCMDSRHWGTWPSFTEKGLIPPSFYGYWPHARGVYIKKAGQVYARSMLFEVRKGVWQHGRVYGIHPQSVLTFMDLMGNAGFRPMDATCTEKNRFGYYRGCPEEMKECTFEMPIIHGSTILPYFDNISPKGPSVANCGVHIAVKDENTVTVTMGPKVKPNIKYDVQTGSHLVGEPPRCLHCREPVDLANCFNTGAVGYFCSASCAKSEGYVIAHTMDGHEVARRANTVITDVTTQVHYTTLAVAKERFHAAVLADNLYVLQENEEHVSGEYVKIMDAAGNLKGHISHGMSQAHKARGSLDAGYRIRVEKNHMPIVPLRAQVLDKVSINMDGDPMIIIKGELPNFVLGEDDDGTMDIRSVLSTVAPNPMVNIRYT